MPSLTWRRAILGLVSAASLSAQSTGTTTADLRGQVRWTGPSAPSELRLLSRAHGTRWVMKPDAQGAFAFRLLPPGSYELELWSAGSLRLHLPGLELHAGTTHELPLTVPPLAQVLVEDTLEPSGEARTQAAWVVDSQLLSRLPINRRSFADLSLVTPMAANARGPINAGAPDSGLSFAGASPRQNNFMVDGLDNNALGNGSGRLLVSQEAIQEFQVITGGYAAEFGRATGGVVNAVTRSGSNQPEGSLFYYLRPGGLDAKSPLSESKAQFRMHQYGASASGPILKDRLFYFICAEGLKRSDEKVVGIDPSVASAIRSAGFDLATGSQAASEANHSLLAKLDWLQNPESRWGLRLLHSRQRSDDLIPWGGLKARSVGGSQDLQDTTLSLSQQWVPSAALMRESKLMYTTRKSDLQALDDARTVQVDLQGVASFGTQRLTPQDTRTRYLQMVDTTTLVLGSHTLKGGIDWLKARNQGSVENNYAGYYLFQAVPAYGLPTSFSAFQAGIPVAFAQGFGDPSTSFSTDYQSAFLQDEWRPRQDLMLRFGLRYDRERIPTFADTSDYQALASTSGANAPLLQTQRDWTSSHLSPRFSLSWQADKAWRFFGGFGDFMGQTNLSPVFGMRTTNGTQGYGVILTALDAYTPYLPWNTLPSHRYASFADLPAGYKSLVIPGSHEAPLSHQWNIGVEWKPSTELSLTLDILHSEGSHLMNMRDVNPYSGSARILPNYSSIYRVDDSGASRYSGQSLSADWRPSPRARFQASYCHSRAEDNVTDWASTLAPQDPLNPAAEWGPSSQDQRHRILLSTLLSSGESGSSWSRNWSLGLQVSMGSGRPYTQLEGSDRNNNGDGSSDRPEGVGRNSENLPWTRRVDLRIARGFAWARVRGEVSLDVFNLFNHANVTEVQNTLNSDSPAYGTPTDYEPMRQLQFGMRFRY